jgi:hypothetical protein
VSGDGHRPVQIVSERDYYNAYIPLKLDADGKVLETTELFDYRDNISSSIVKIPYLCSNTCILLSFSFGVYICQLIRYASPTEITKVSIVWFQYDHVLIEPGYRDYKGFCCLVSILSRSGRARLRRLQRFLLSGFYMITFWSSQATKITKISTV